MTMLWSRHLLVHLAVDVNCEESLTDDYLEVDANKSLLFDDFQQKKVKNYRALW